MLSNYGSSSMPQVTGTPLADGPLASPAAQVAVEAVPEPGTAALLAAGLIVTLGAACTPPRRQYCGLIEPAD